MMTLKSLCSFLLIYVSAVVAANCQSTKPESNNNIAGIQVIARAYGDSIVLRWGANTPLGWHASNQSGFIIERILLVKDGKVEKDVSRTKILLTTIPLLPWPLPRWERLAKSNNYAAIAAQALYGKSFEVTKKNANMMEMINKARELENRFSFALFAADQSLAVAEASGLKFTDRNVKKGEKYLYKIYSPQTHYKLDTGTLFISPTDILPLPKPVGLKAEFSDRVVMLSWNKLYYENLYTNYSIERSDDGGKTFYKVNNLPVVNTSPSSKVNTDLLFFVDSIPKNNYRYFFRIKGLTPFDEVSPPSELIEGEGLSKNKSAAPSVISSKADKQGGIKITWSFPEKLNSTISGFEILRSDKVNGNYSKVASLPTTARSFLDLKAQRRNYYIINARRDSVTISASFPAFGQLIDSLPPLPAIGLSGQINDRGLLTLRWNGGKEDDLYGYKVYMANNLKEDFTQVSKAPIKDTVFQDSININTLTKKVYYKILALDENFNQSKFSNVLELKRPDIVPPVSPRFDNYTISDTNIYLSWIPSTSEDVVKHILYRRDKSTSIWNEIKVFDLKPEVKSFTDKDVKPQIEYVYSIVAVDESNLESGKDQLLTLALVDFGKRPIVENVKINVDRSKRQVSLNWKFEKKGVDKFLVYRGTKGQPLRLYKTLSGDLNTFIDNGLVINTTYKYSIRVSYLDGAVSSFSKEFSIDY